jgi:hypothetical protein
MWKILAGIMMQGIYGSLMLSVWQQNEKGLIIFFSIVLTVILWLPGTVLLLKGLKQFFLDDILSELKKMNQSTTPKQ